MITAPPAAVSTSATVAPAGPVPTITASQSRSATVRHLLVGPPAGLDVTGETDGGPSLAAPVAAVDRVPVQRLAGVLEHLVAERLVARVEPALLLGRRHRGEVVAERGEARPVQLLQAGHRTVELAFGDAA